MQNKDEIQKTLREGGYTREMVYLSMLSAFAVAIHSAEASFPTPPWLKPGLANIITLTTIACFGLRCAIYVTLLRVVVGSLVIGTFLNPAFFLSLAGGAASVLGMGLMHRWFSKTFSLIGISLAGAYLHSLAQMAFVSLVFIRHTDILYLFPIVLASALPTGVVTGIASIHASEKLSAFLEEKKLV
ncbi:MAG: Gx transporter family protein [Nitrospinae bacterium]|nr:Gx transporter family protein [Nitrospinota bacterium]